MVQKIIAVMSGKGGIGKSTISCLVAAYLSGKYKTVLVDTDICGPSITNMMGVKGKLVKSETGFTPVPVSASLSVLSFGLALKPEDVVIWRGPKKRALLKLFFDSISGYEYVIVDTPPGVSEEHAFLKEMACSVILATTPQNVSLNDTQNTIEFISGSSMKIIGIIENMSFFQCECCRDSFYPFGKNGGELLAAEYGLPFLGKIEIDNSTSSALDSGTFLEKISESKAFQSIERILKDIEI